MLFGLGDQEAAPFVLFEVAWPAGSMRLDPSDSFGTRFDQGEGLIRDGLTMQFVDGHGAVVALPGPDHDRGLALLSSGGGLVVDLPHPVDQLELVVASFINVAVVEYQASAGDSFATIDTEIVGIDDSPATVQFTATSQPVNRVRITVQGDADFDGDHLDKYLERVEALRQRDAGSDEGAQT